MSCPECLRFPVPTSNHEEVAVNETLQSELHRCRACGQFPGFDPSKY